MKDEPEMIKLLPAYSLASVSRLINAKPSTLRAWFRGRNYEVKGERRTSAPVLPTKSGSGEPLSFIDLVEAHVFQLIRKQYRIPIRNIRAATEYLASIKGDLIILAHKDFYMDSGHLLLNVKDKLISLSERGQLVDKQILESGLKQLKYGPDGYASEFFPRTGNSEQEQFVISPKRNFGRLCVSRSGISAEIIAVRFAAGESVQDLAEDYDATVNEIEEAIRWHDRIAA